MSAILKVQDLVIHYRSATGVVRAVDGVSFCVEAGQSLGIVGESGAGKSSLGLGILRLLPKNIAKFSGKISLDGVNCTELSDKEFRKEIRWQKISMVFQGAMESFNPVLRVGHQVAEPLQVVQHATKSDAFRSARALLQKMFLPPEVFDRYPHELSGGMKQRALIAMALILNPKLTILDEPTSALDVSIQAQIMNLLKELKTTMGLASIFITHDIALASDLCDNIAVMYGGQIAEIGSAKQILTSPQHPYTQKLLASIPRLQSDIGPEFIPGMPPNMAQGPSGCRFHPRCTYTFDRCSTETPSLFSVAQGHEARCWLVEKTS